MVSRICFQYSEIIRGNNAEVCAMAERQHWSARWLDWGIRGNWLWSVFPSGWKVLIWSVFVGALGALSMARQLPYVEWIGFLSSVFVYVVIWAIVQTVGIRTKRLSVGAGRVIAHGEVRHHFQTTDRDPRITIEFDKRPAPFGHDPGVRDRKMMLCNDGGTEAFKVQIREIRFKSGIAEFSEIPQIRHGHRSAVTIYISAPEEGKEAPYGVYDLELLMVEEIKNRAKTSDLSPLETKCDIFYEDYSKRRFTTQATLSHNWNIWSSGRLRKRSCSSLNVRCLLCAFPKNKLPLSRDDGIEQFNCFQAVDALL